jgi:hypothetical protein
MDIEVFILLAINNVHNNKYVYYIKRKILRYVPSVYVSYKRNVYICVTRSCVFIIRTRKYYTRLKCFRLRKASRTQITLQFPVSMSELIHLSMSESKVQKSVIMLRFWRSACTYLFDQTTFHTSNSYISVACVWLETSVLFNVFDLTTSVEERLDTLAEPILSLPRIISDVRLTRLLLQGKRRLIIYICHTCTSCQLYAFRYGSPVHSFARIIKYQSHLYGFSPLCNPIILFCTKDSIHPSH